MQAIALFTEQDAIEAEERITALDAEIIDWSIHQRMNPDFETVLSRLAAVQLQEWQRLETILASLR